MAMERPRVSPWSPTWAVAAQTTSSIRSRGTDGVAVEQGADGTDGHVVGAGAGVVAGVLRASDGEPHAVDVVRVVELGHGVASRRAGP
jgi:hypothetical protein